MDIRVELEKAIHPHFIHPTVMELLVQRVEEMVSSGRCTRLEDLIYELEESPMSEEDLIELIPDNLMSELTFDEKEPNNEL